MADDAEVDDSVSDEPRKNPTYRNDERAYDDQEPDDEHAKAIERLQLSAEAYDKQQTRETLALRFQVPELQWSESARTQRAAEEISGITVPGRPILSIPKIDQAIQLVLNQARAAKLGVSVHAQDERTRNHTIETVTGMYRSIERDSRADIARMWAFERAVKAGRGCWRVVTQPAYDFKRTGDQDIRIARLLYQESAYLDPFATEPDWSDGEWGHVLEWVSIAKYRRMYKLVKGKRDENGKAEDLPSRLAQMNNGELTKLQEFCPDWIKGDGEGRAVLIGEYMYVEDRPDDEAEATRQRWRVGEYRRLCWRRMNAIEFMDRGVIHSRYVTLVPTIGRELIPFDQERRWVGIYEPNMDGQRMFNYSASNLVESMAQEPRNTWMLAEGQEIGHERELLLANVRNFPYARYRPVALNGELVPPPKRESADTSKLGLAVEALRMSGEFINAGTAMYEPSLGNHSPNVRTKGGTLALQQQSDSANSNWLDNQADISMTLEAKIILSMIPFYYDRRGRSVQTLGTESNDSKRVLVNVPYRVQGGQPAALPYGSTEEQLAADAAVRDPNDDAEMVDLRTAIMGATVSVGKGYKSRVDQGADEMGQLFQAAPELFHILGDLYLRFRDFPGAQEAAERMKKLLPPQLQDKDAQQDPRMQIEQMKQALEAAQAEIQKLQPEKMKQQTALLLGKLEADTKKAIKLADVHLQAMKDATAIDVAKIQLQGKAIIVGGQAEDEAIALGREHAADAHEAERQRAHEAALAVLGHGADAGAAEADHQRALEAGAVEHDQTLDEGAQSHQQQLEQGDAAAAHAADAADQGHAQTLEQQQQAAALAPQPDAGGEGE